MQAKELLHILKTQNKRMFIAWLITFIAFIGLLGYTIWLLNDIGSAEVINTQEIDSSDIEYSDIINRDYYWENQTD